MAQQRRYQLKKMKSEAVDARIERLEKKIKDTYYIHKDVDIKSQIVESLFRELAIPVSELTGLRFTIKEQNMSLSIRGVAIINGKVFQRFEFTIALHKGGFKNEESGIRV